MSKPGWGYSVLHQNAGFSQEIEVRREDFPVAIGPIGPLGMVIRQKEQDIRFLGHGGVLLGGLSQYRYKRRVVRIYYN